MNNIIVWCGAHADDILFFSTCCIPPFVAFVMYIMNAWNKSIARRRLVFLLKFLVWIIAYGLSSLSKKMLKFVLR